MEDLTRFISDHIESPQNLRFWLNTAALECRRGDAKTRALRVAGMLRDNYETAAAWNKIADPLNEFMVVALNLVDWQSIAEDLCILVDREERVG